MIIGIDGNEANSNHRVGIGQYAFNILKYLYQIEASRKNTGRMYLIYLKKSPASDLPKETTFWHYKVLSPKFFWTQLAFPIALSKEAEKPSMILSLTHYAPRFFSGKSIITIMDLSYLHFRNLFTLKDYLQLKLWSEYSIRHAYKIITISNFTKNEIIKYYSVPASVIEVIYPGYDKDNYNITNKIPSRSYLAKKYRVSNPFILFVGTIQPRKNINILIDAFNIVAKNITNLNLVLIGKKGWLYKEIMAKIKDSPVSDHIKNLDYIDTPDLAIFYRYSHCFVLPSLYEGFGLPVIEAMACGCPVVASKTSSPPEIIGEAGILVNPQSAQEIAYSILRIIKNSSFSKNLIKRGLAQTKYYDWLKTAYQVDTLLTS